MRRSGLLIFTALLTAALGRAAFAATPAEVDRAIEKAKAFLYAHQGGGIWDPAKNPAGGKGHNQWGGKTAIATYALLASGESALNPKLTPAVSFLKTADITGMYALGLRAQLWHFLPQSKEVAPLIKRDGDLLLASMKTEGEAKGMFNYPVKDGPGGRYDHSISQYGVLGLWSVVQAGYEVPTQAWMTMDGAWREQQEPDGGWAYIYKHKDNSRASMTAAGLATLFITQDYINLGKGAECKGNIRDASIEKGLKWMADNFKNVGGRRGYYTLYGIERVGVASGYKYFGTIDWYDDGADFLVRTQAANGSWGADLPDTCFAMLFLVRGRAPVVMNKLEYALDANGDKVKPANWNERPRDAANLTRWMGKQLERDLNWQIVNLKVSVDDLHDAPILYIAGNQNLMFSDADQAKLKTFVEQGGMILGNADCASDAFANSFQKLGQKLFPEYEFRELPKDHLIFNHPFTYKKWRVAPVVRGLSNGSRELMVLFPTADFSKLWQLGVYGGREEGHQLMWNLYFYAVDRTQLRFKGQTYIVHKSPQVQAAKTISVARLQYGGNWNPEPGGWRRLAAVTHNSNGTDLDVKTVKLGTGDLAKGDFRVAHLTGTTKFRLDDTAKSELRDYVARGGTLVIEGCGGSSDFAGAAEEQLAALWPGAEPKVIAPEHALFAAGTKAGAIAYRAYAKKLLGNLTTPRLKAIEVNNRMAVFFSFEDLSTGLVGQAIDGIYGYEPQSATDLMRNILFYAAAGGSAAPKAEPAKPEVAKTEPAKPAVKNETPVKVKPPKRK